MKDLIALLVVAFVVIIKAANAKEKKKTAEPAAAAPDNAYPAQEEGAQAAKAISEAVPEAENVAESVAEKGTLEDISIAGPSQESVCTDGLAENSVNPVTGSSEFDFDPEKMIIYSEILFPDWEKE